ncbi:MAG: 3-deoxy-D-manno-octulosonic acid transferase [Candidatus Electronema sp. V4]|uniref:3-deoxy-D-manno-octulosonic acid transferase n=1 Tax=Candidatus Electronema sp. V4 TaxID=3454756 RepID=UPI00405567E0
MLHTLYRTLGTAVHALLPAVLPVLNITAPGWETAQRLGRYQDNFHRSGPLIWIHAASVGEVQAARALTAALRTNLLNCQFFLTTMTRQGREAARLHLPPAIRCELAPLDTPRSVRRALCEVRPDAYVCLETELWPIMLRETSRAGVPLLLLNGRMSERSFRRYRLLPSFMAELLSNLKAIGVIGKQDGARFRELGAEQVQVCGNLKYDLPAADAGAMRDKYRQLLKPGGKKIFICGSTRTGEEELLLPVYHRLRAETAAGLLWIIAPRHLNRLNEVRQLLGQAGLEYELFSDCAAKGRNKDIVLVDSLGELADLYAAADVSFCGGSLVNKGGHNIMEPVRWRRPVCFGPFMQDFADAAEMVLAAGAGFQARDSDELAERLSALLHDERLYAQTCQAAEQLAAAQQGSAQRQAELVMRELKGVLA